MIFIPIKELEVKSHLNSNELELKSHLELFIDPFGPVHCDITAA